MAVGGSPERSASLVSTSSKALVESSTFSANLVVIWVSSTSISSRRFLPSAARSAPWRRKDSMVLCRNRRRAAAGGAGACRRGRGGGVRFAVAPRPGVQRNAGVEGADLGLRGIEGGAQLGIRGDAFQVTHHAHGDRKST